MVLAFESQLQYFIIESSMLGLGISLALYSFIIPQISIIFNNQAQRLRKANEIMRVLAVESHNKLMKGEIDQELQNNLKIAILEVEKEKNVKFHYGIGFLVTGILFSISTIFPLLDIWQGGGSSLIQNLAKLSMFSLIVGTGVLIYVWLKVFFDIKDLLKKMLDKANEESDKELEKVEKLAKQPKVKERSIMRKRSKRGAK